MAWEGQWLSCVPAGEKRNLQQRDCTGFSPVSLLIAMPCVAPWGLPVGGANRYAGAKVRIYCVLRKASRCFLQLGGGGLGGEGLVRVG